MSSAPVPTVTVDQPQYRRGGTVRASVQVVDADNRVVQLATDGTGPDGTALHVDQRQTYSDIPHVTWRWRGTTAVLGTGLTLTLIAPPRGGVLEAVVVDAQGNTAVASCPVVVQGLALGVDADTYQTPTVWRAELDAVTAGLAPDGPTKLFQATGLPSPTKYAIPAGMFPHYTFPTMPTEAAFRAWLATLTGPAWISCPQEMDRKLSLADARTRVLAMAGWMDAAPEGVELVPNITASWQENHGAPWSDWMFTHERISKVGVDMYVGGPSNYRPITAQLASALKAATAAGLELVVPEFGVIVPTGATATNYDERARWITATLAAFDDAGVTHAAWWNAPPTSQIGSFRLAQGDPGWDALRTWWTE